MLDLAFASDSRSLASTSEDRRESGCGRSRTAAQIGVFHGHTDFVHAVAFSPDGRELASGGLDATMKVSGRRTSLPVVFEGHTGWVGRLWYRRDGRRVVTAAAGYQVAGETTMGWDPDTGEMDPSLTRDLPRQAGGGIPPTHCFPLVLQVPRAGDQPRWQAGRPCLGRRGSLATGRAEHGVCDGRGRGPGRGDRTGVPHPDRSHRGSDLYGFFPMAAGSPPPA